LEILEKQGINQSSDVLDIVDCERDLLTSNIRFMIKQAYPVAISEGKFDKEKIRFLKKIGGKFQDSNLINGVVIRKEKAHRTCQTNLETFESQYQAESWESTV
jgi:hypothetical protein